MCESNQSSICYFAPRHSDSDNASPYKGRYQHCQTNEELVSEKYQPVTPYELAESTDHSAIELWTDLKVNAGPVRSSYEPYSIRLIHDESENSLLPEIVEGPHEETLSTEENKEGSS